MDSRLIYSTGKFKLENVVWLNTTKENGAWIFCGSDLELIKRLVGDHFFDDSLYLVYSRGESKQIDKNNMGNEISTIMGKQSFSIWDSHFTKVVEFSNSGDVMRLGIYPTREYGR